MIASIFYAISFVSIFTGIFFVKKSEKKLNGLSWTVVSFVLSLCFQAMMAGVMSVLKIPVSILSIGIFNMGLSILILLVFWKKKLGIQTYYVHFVDVAFAGILIAVVLSKFISQFGMNLDIHYITSDPSIHLYLALDVVNEHQVKSLYFSGLTNALFIEMLAPVFGEFIRYKAFIIMDGIMLFVSGMSLFSIICQENDKLKKSIYLPKLFLVLAYVLAYPTNNMVFGFVYLGIGVSILAIIITVLKLYTDDGKRWVSIVMLMLLHLGLGVCYSLFIPVGFITTFLCILYHNTRRKRSFWSWVVDNLSIFLIPCIYVVAFSFIGMFSGSVTEAESAIGREGFIYRDIFVNAWIILIPVLAGIISFIQKKEVAPELIGLIVLVLEMLFLGIGVLRGQVSTYYFYKMSYPASLFLYSIAYEGIKSWSKESWKLLVAYCSSIVLLFGLYYADFEEILHEKNQYLVSEKKLPTILHIYSFNDQILEEIQPYDQYKMKLYEKIYYEYKNENIVCIGNLEDCYWFQALTGQRMKDPKIKCWEEGNENFQNLWTNIDRNEQCKHILVLKDSDYYKNNRAEINKLRAEYEDDFAMFIPVIQ